MNTLLLQYEIDIILSLTSGHINVWMTDIHPIVRQHKHNTLSWLSFYIECLMEIALEEQTKPVQSGLRHFGTKF